MTLRSTLYAGSVTHRRLRPRRHSLRYRVFWMLLDLDEIDRLANRLWLFSRNCFNALSFHDSDHGNGSEESLRIQIARTLAEADINPAGLSVQLLCMPRVFGYGFNPLSVYFCRNLADELTAIIYEVHNTFGERHSYLIPIKHADKKVIDQNCRKTFYVSPFLDMEMSYRFWVRAPDEFVRIAIRAADCNGPVLIATLSGSRRALSNANLIALLAIYPFLTIKVIVAIHWHALRLWLKGMRLRRRPHPPPIPVTIVNAES